MKIKLDENMPSELAVELRRFGHDVHTVQDEGLTGEPDATIFGHAVAESRLLITQDLDFSDVRTFAPGSHPGIVLLRLKDPSRRQIIERFSQALALQDITAWSGCFVVISDHKVRIRTP